MKPEKGWTTRLNTAAAYFNASQGLIRLPMSGAIYTFGNAADVEAFIILHELGHELHGMTGFVADDNNPEANENNSLLLLRKCFPDALVGRK